MIEYTFKIFIFYAGVCYFLPSLCSDSENATTTEQTTEVPDYYNGGDYEEYDYDNYDDNSL